MTSTPNVIETKVVVVNNGARGPAGPSPDNLVYVDNLLDLPNAVAGVRTLPDGVVYFLTKEIDLAGDRFECVGVSAIIGTSSETARLKSTGLINTPLITSSKTLPIQNISIECDYAVELNGEGATGLDWKSVNFVNTRKVGNIRNYSNFVMTDSAFLNSGGLVFGGSIGTVGFDGCLMSIRPSTIGVAFETDAVVSRRFRTLFTSFVVPDTATGVSFPETVAIPVEAYILDTVNFSGAGTYLSGVNSSSNSSLFYRCTGISNTEVSGQMYIRDNAVATAMPDIDQFVKLDAATVGSADNQKYLVGNNRLTCQAVIQRRYLIQATVSFTSGNNNVIELGFYDSKLGGIRPPSVTKATANAGGRAENVSFHCVVSHTLGDYIEVWAANTTSTSPITPTDMNVVITAL